MVQPVISLEEIMMAKMAVRRVFVHEALINYIVEVVGATRKHPSIVLGVSPRGSQLLMRASQAAAFLDGRDFVKPDDIKGIAPYVFGHRILPKVKANRINHAEIIETSPRNNRYPRLRKAYRIYEPTRQRAFLRLMQVPLPSTDLRSRLLKRASDCRFRSGSVSKSQSNFVSFSFFF